MKKTCFYCKRCKQKPKNQFSKCSYFKCTILILEDKQKKQIKKRRNCVLQITNYYRLGSLRTVQSQNNNNFLISPSFPRVSRC